MRYNPSRPPRLARAILSCMKRYAQEHSVNIELEEEFREIAKVWGPLKATIWYWGQVIYSIPTYFQLRLVIGGAMLVNHIKIALRNIKRHKGYSFINISGLVLGMACTIFILVWIQDEISFDKFHEHARSLYLVATQTQQGDEINVEAGSPPALAPALKEEYAEVVNASRLQNGSISVVLKYGNKIYRENIRLADPSFLEMFTFPLIKGDVKTALALPHNIVVSEKMAEKYFGDDNPIGKVLRVDNSTDFIVGGVLQDIPDNSIIRFDFLAPLSYMVERVERPDYLSTWYNFSFLTFIQIQENAHRDEVDKKIKGRIKQGKPDSTGTSFLCPYTGLYLHGLGGGGRITQVRMFGLVAFLILLVACINFVNLTTARSAVRAKEVGLRKVIGADRKSLIRQFYGESLVLSFLSVVIALGVVAVLLQPFNKLVGKGLTVENLFHLPLMLQCLAVAVLTGLLAGFYPALILSAFQPGPVLRGTLLKSGRRVYLRRVLVVLQFAVSVALIVGTAVIYKQVNFLRGMDLGFESRNLLYIPLSGELSEHAETAKLELLKHPGILGVSLTSHSPTGIYWDGHNWDWEGRKPETNPWITYFSTDEDFVNTFNAEIAAGVFYEKEFTSGTSESMGKVVINQTFAKIMGMENPVGTRLTHEDHTYTVIGVIRDFKTEPLYRTLEPLVVFYRPQRFRYGFIRVNPESTRDVLRHIEMVYKQYNPEFPFSYSFLDEDYRRLYRSEQQLGMLINTFAGLGVLISCMGLFGLAAFMAERRTKEVGIRKILGARTGNIFKLLSMEFMLLVALANAFAWPVAYWFVHDWLQDFAYRTAIGWELFLAAGLLSFGIALLTVGWQSFTASRNNPVEALRYE
jgi:ABC-type antimicrobial peptide transport system permease subunit